MPTAASPNHPQVNGERLWASLMDLARIGATEKGGVRRLALTELDRLAREEFIGWASDAGCTIRVDQIGNIRARLAGRDPSRPVVMTGSHIDSQPTGGKFDGAYGVMAGLEVLRALRDHGLQTEADVEVVVWTNEEGSRFVPVMMGSAVFAGAFPLASALAAEDLDGARVGDELTRIGFAGEPLPPEPIDSYFEAHIEQGPVLEDAGLTLGVVTGALGQRWFDCKVTGFEAHAGPTPMPLRRDALQAATRIMQEVVEIALRQAPHGRGTVGQVQVHPNSRNVIPGAVTFSIDLRAATDAALDHMEAELRACLDRVVAERGVTIDLDCVSRFAALAFDPGCVEAVRDAAVASGFEPMDLVSGAGHDAIHVASIAPAAMIFIPCKDGVSHNEIEDAQPAHVTAGANVLMRCILHRAGIAS